MGQTDRRQPDYLLSVYNHIVRLNDRLFIDLCPVQSRYRVIQINHRSRCILRFESLLLRQTKSVEQYGQSMISFALSSGSSPGSRWRGKQIVGSLYPKLLIKGRPLLLHSPLFASLLLKLRAREKCSSTTDAVSPE